ncbi:MAG: c-type cytochrome [Opitutaceae bacterium]|nr:c-type cytochrome [Opitutaceae bacterium]
MRRGLRHGLAVLLAVVSARAEPRVVGFDRFHAAAPDSAGGRLLYNELGCVNCHGGDTGLPSRRGPDLTTVTTRANADWLRAFIADPAGQRRGTTMPHLLANRDAADAEAVVHYLGTLTRRNPAPPRKIAHLNAELGKALYHTKGCVACHAPQSDYSPPDGRPGAGEFSYGAVAFPALAEKYDVASLAAVVRDPLVSRPDGRMPRIEMEGQDALDIAAYLLGITSSDGEVAPKLPQSTPDAALAKRGREIVTTARCAACHTPPTAPQVQLVALQRTTGGCVDEKPAAGLPRYALSPAQRSALLAYLAGRDASVTPAQTVHGTLAALNCVACHERDGQGGPDAARRPYFLGDHNLGDTGRFPPPLTGIGRKLQPEWLAETMAGKRRERPYLATQMPVYGAAVTNLPGLLATCDARQETALPAGDAAAGRKLLGTHGGVNCITCHRWGQRASLGIHALDISNLAVRLQPGWLREYLINPAAHRPGTLMPSFWPEGKAANREVLGGDTDRQIASIIAFARDGKGLPEGFPTTAAREFELIPGSRPIVLRTFMAEVGTHAILVGFPAGVHLAYDGRDCRPALTWKSRFFDAYGTWFSRFAPFEKPLGESVVKWPAPSEAGGARKFEGYRLDDAGVPTFLISVDGVAVAERFEPGEAGTLRRTLTWNLEAMRSFALMHPPGLTVRESPSSIPGRLEFIYTWP